jgi:hypothetical protein
MMKPEEHGLSNMLQLEATHPVGGGIANGAAVANIACLAGPEK